ncbi:MAG TPA: hypothetical protein VK446_08395 [Methylocystis sp.]|nr:hypothetical protein [Methylocystis sp.]HXZ17636.1 hypothetical protein [Roseiarcus sp.]
MRRSFTPLLCAAMFAAVFGPAPADARGPLGYDQDQCVLKIGPDFLYFSGYQAGAGRRKFCEDVPNVGETTFVFDYGQDELREMKTDFRILKAGGSGEDPSAEGPTVAYLAPKVYLKGTFNLVHRFDEAGNYVGVVTMETPNGDKWTARFPFSVGGAPTSETPYLLMALAAVLAIGLYFFGGDKKKGDKKKKAKV